MNNAATFATFPVSGASTPEADLEGKTLRTHTLNLETGKPLCRVKAESLLEDGLWGGEGCTERKPTCPCCLKKDPRFK